MTNAKKELLDHIKDRHVEYISIKYEQCNSKNLIIKGTFNEVINLLDFNYNSGGYGIQELFGYIWYDDGTWSERSEYDGAERWEHRERPDYDIEV